MELGAAWLAAGPPAGPAITTARSGALHRPPSSLASHRRRPAPAARRAASAVVSAAGAAASLPSAQHLGGAVEWAVEVTRHTLTMPQVLQHLQQLERMEAAAHERRAAAGRPHPPPGASTHQEHSRHVSWVEHATSAAASLMESIQSDAESSSSEDELLAALAALPPDALSQAQQAAVVLAAWGSAAHTKPAGFDAEARMTLPGLADVAVVSRGGWQRHSWKGCNQDSFLALPLAAGSAACQGCASQAACCSSALAIGVFDGHGRAGQAASAHLRNALASGLLMHNQLALMALPACQRSEAGNGTSSTGSSSGSSGSSHTSGGKSSGRAQGGRQQAAAAAAARLAAAASGDGDGAPAAASSSAEAAALLERCFAAAASTMPSTGADFSLSGSTAVMCIVEPGSVTAAWVGDSRAVLGVHRGGRYIALGLTRDHKPSSPMERARIERSGGWVMQTLVDEGGRPAGPHRVYLPNSTIPGLAVSRCFGDFVASSAGVTSTPDIVTVVLPTRELGQLLGGAGRAGSHNGSHNGGSAGGQQQQQQQRGRAAPGAEAAQAGREAGRWRRGGQQQAQPQQQPQQGQGQGQGQQRRSRSQSRPRGQGTHPAASPAAASGSALSEAAASHILIVASDGLWEFVSNAEAVRIASKFPTAQAAAEALALEAQAQWALKFGGAACDDVTVAVAFLPEDCPPGPPPPAAAATVRGDASAAASRASGGGRRRGGHVPAARGAGADKAAGAPAARAAGAAKPAGPAGQGKGAQAQRRGGRGGQGL